MRRTTALSTCRRHSPVCSGPDSPLHDFMCLLQMPEVPQQQHGDRHRAGTVMVWGSPRAGKDGEGGLQPPLIRLGESSGELHRARALSSQFPYVVLVTTATTLSRRWSYRFIPRCRQQASRLPIYISYRLPRCCNAADSSGHSSANQQIMVLAGAPSGNRWGGERI